MKSLSFTSKYAWGLVAIVYLPNWLAAIYMLIDMAMLFKID